MNYLVTYTFPFLVAFTISVISAYFLIKIGKKYNIVDKPNARKMHKEPIPLLGGVAIALGLVVSTLIFAESSQRIFTYVYVFGLLSIAIMGLLDDIYDISALIRLLLQIMFAGVIFAFGLKNYLQAPIVYGSLFTNMILGGMVVVWIVGMINAINWSDGLDGLAGGLSLISSVGFAIIFSLEGRNEFAIPVIMSFMGALVGFLPFNLHPAKMFMGDCGSMFIGLTLGTLSIASLAQANTILAIIVPVFMIMVPIGDATMAILRRIIQRKPLMEADKKHFHHQLMKKYEHQRKVVIIEWVLQFLFMLMGVIIYFKQCYLIGWIILLIAFITGIVVIVRNQKAETNAES